MRSLARERRGDGEEEASNNDGSMSLTVPVAPVVRRRPVPARSLHSRRPAAGSTLPRQRCSPAGRPGRPTPPQTPLELRHPLLLLHLLQEPPHQEPPPEPSSCSTPPRPWCSPADLRLRPGPVAAAAAAAAAVGPGPRGRLLAGRPGGPDPAWRRRLAAGSTARSRLLRPRCGPLPLCWGRVVRAVARAGMRYPIPGERTEDLLGDPHGAVLQAVQAGRVLV